ncbi:MAG TPA: type II toxin-antitoxin system death-on-curing family toxin [Candidatus Lokiarchaeia archaeon]|nr:type II toxin-antitoxin system death-on-curing family toxin [Candidatus Lokiarchaeia archaeon]
MTWYPSADYILALFEETIGTKPVLMNRQGLMTTLDKARWGIPFHEKPTLWDQVTILFKEIVENHYFMDGNKRIGILVASLFLNKNGLDFSPPSGEIFSKTMETAQCLKNLEEIKQWFKTNSQKSV